MISRKIKYKKFESQRRFGIELEMGESIKKKDVCNAIASVSSHSVVATNYALSSNNKFWHIKPDATCGKNGRNGPKGVEVASFVGRGMDDLQHMASVADKLYDIGCRVNDNCGLHIHAEALDLNKNQICSLVAHWIKLEPVLSLILPMRRYHSEYCKFIFSPLSNMKFQNGRLLKRSSYNPFEFWQTIAPQNLAFYENSDRRSNLNLVNYVRSLDNNTTARRTLELRWPEGTLDPKEIKCWVRLFLLFIETCKNKSMPKNLWAFTLDEALYHLGLYDEKCFLILSSGLHETKTWFLERILKHAGDSENFYQDYSQIVLQRDSLDRAKAILNLMWSPLKNYA